MQRRSHGTLFSCNTPTSGEQEARSLKCPAKLSALFPLSVSLPLSVALITFCFTQEAVSAARSLSLPKQFVLFFFCFVKQWVPLKHLFSVRGFDLNLKSRRSCFCAVHRIDYLFCDLIFIHILVELSGELHTDTYSTAMLHHCCVSGVF